MKYAIIGAGASGLAAGMFLKHPFEIFEKNNYPGGLISSFTDQGFTFDLGPHILFSKNQKILHFIIQSLGKNVYQSKRNNKVYFKNKFIKWPFENSLSELDPEDNYYCLINFLNNKFKTKFSKPKDLEQWLLHHFGEGICKSYLFPYNEKIWNVSVSKLSMIWADRIPLPSASDVIKSAIGIKTEGNKHQLYYYYPLRNGYQAIADIWSKKLPIRYNFKVDKIEKTKKRTFLIFSGKQYFESERIISTMPIHELMKIIKNSIPDFVQKAVNSLLVNSVIIVSLGIRGEDFEKYSAVYFPQSDFLVNRISFPKTFSPNNAPSDHYSIQAEITCKQNSHLLDKSDSFIFGHVTDGLINYGIIKNRKSIVCNNIKKVKYGYVVYDNKYEKNVRIIRKWFPEFGIDLLGRFSYFEYINLDGVVERAREVIKVLNKNAK